LASSLTIAGIHAAYGAVRVIEDVSIKVNAGETVTLLGTNGNGKSTLMKCIMGIVRPSAGSIVAEIDGIHHDLVGRTTEEIADLGIAMVPEGRRLFPKLTVEENLLLGAFRPTARAQLKRNYEVCCETFPRLAERRSQLAGSLSGGEQQMLAFARALIAKPKALLLDEPSMGLAPKLVAQVFEIIASERERGTSILLVEQNARKALALADYAYVLERGTIRLEGTGKQLLGHDEITAAYLGEAATANSATDPANP
jgi:branched-chain amino acid transport system ATP-binding protein